MPLKPQSSTPASCSSLSIISPIAALCRIHAAKTPQGDHPPLLQPLQIRIVILPPPWIFTQVQEIDLKHWQILKLKSVIMLGPDWSVAITVGHNTGLSLVIWSQYRSVIDRSVTLLIFHYSGHQIKYSFLSLWWQQDRVPPHCTNANMDYLETQFQGRVISRRHRRGRNWPPRSPDLSPLDFFLWGYLKSKVYNPWISWSRTSATKSRCSTQPWSTGPYWTWGPGPRGASPTTAATWSKSSRLQALLRRYYES